ncbi:MAG: glutamyl-tRNA amidotransferase [Gammaproteobacteria bacterium]|nr:glutamyl-tRNA amidotransferase [Gammaproteobacteria bacterium]
MSLLPKDVAKVAHLARLALNEADIPKYSENLTNILGFIEQMNEVDTSHIEPMAHPLDAHQRLRPDVVTEHNQRELFQTLTLHTEAGLYLVPQVIETKIEE